MLHNKSVVATADTPLVRFALDALSPPCHTSNVRRRYVSPVNDTEQNRLTSSCLHLLPSPSLLLSSSSPPSCAAPSTASRSVAASVAPSSLRSRFLFCSSPCSLSGV